MVKQLLVFLLFSASWGHSSLAQNVNLDSLWSVWKNEGQADTSRLKAIHEIAWNGLLFSMPDSARSVAQMQYEFATTSQNQQKAGRALNTIGVSYLLVGNYPESIAYFKQHLKLSTQINDSEGEAIAIGNLGIAYKNSGVLDSAKYYYQLSVDLNQKLKNKKGESNNLMNLATVHLKEGNHVKAIDLYTRALKIQEQMDDRRAIALTTAGIATVYQTQRDLESAERYYRKALQLFEAEEFDGGILSALHNLGSINAESGRTDTALTYYNKTLSLSRKINDKRSQANVLHSIGKMHTVKGNSDSAEYYYNESLAIALETESKEIETYALNSLSKLYLENGEIDNSIRFGEKALGIAQEHGFITLINYSSKTLSLGYREIGMHTKALEMYELHVQMRDSIMSEENQREVLRQEYKYEYEKEALADSLVFAKKEALSQAEIKRKNQQRNALIGGLGLISIFSGLLFNRFRVTRKQKKVIEIQKAEVEVQKEQVEHKNEEIMASITYAKKLQTAVLPPARLVKEYFADSFLLYLPRDIVSGDFYWMESQGDVSYFAVADCTGHGVPGAMLSVIGMNGLNRALNEQNLTDPKDILTSLSEHVERHFEQSESMVRDGMDICLCALDNNSKKLTFSGANNPVWIARNGEMLILGADRRAIGHHNTDTQFTQQEFQLQKGDVIYLSSDGYQDQLGGPKTRKLMKKVFREKLLALSEEPLDKQREILLSDLELWQQNTPQTDDICVMGIRA